MDTYTPVQKIDNYWVKRDDLFSIANVRGGKARTCFALAQEHKGLVTAGARASPQAVIVARIAAYLGVPCRVYMPSGELLLQGNLARQAGADIVQVSPGYNSVIKARAKQDAIERGWGLIPFGMISQEAVRQTSQQCSNLPFGKFKRLVIPVGSGMSLCGVLHGLKRYGGSIEVPVLGVQVGANPIKQLDQYGPMMWRNQCRIVISDLKYHQEPENKMLGGIELDPIYESKCLPFLEPDDLFWIVGTREYD